MFYLTNLINSEYDVCGICSQFLVLGQPPSLVLKTIKKEGCPCQSSLTYEDCCGQYHKSGGHAPTAEALMRSRYSAYVMGNAQYLFRTWHTSTRPSLSSLQISGAQTLIGLKILATKAGGVDDNKGVVEFISSRYSPSLLGEIEQYKEKSLFAKVKGNWVYIDAI